MIKYRQVRSGFLRAETGINLLGHPVIRPCCNLFCCVVALLPIYTLWSSGPGLLSVVGNILTLKHKTLTIECATACRVLLEGSKFTKTKTIIEHRILNLMPESLTCHVGLYLHQYSCVDLPLLTNHSMSHPPQHGQSLHNHKLLTGLVLGLGSQQQKGALEGCLRARPSPLLLPLHRKQFSERQ